MMVRQNRLGGMICIYRGESYWILDLWRDELIFTEVTVEGFAWVNGEDAVCVVPKDEDGAPFRDARMSVKTFRKKLIGQ